MLPLTPWWLCLARKSFLPALSSSSIFRSIGCSEGGVTIVFCLLDGSGGSVGGLDKVKCFKVNWLFDMFYCNQTIFSPFMSWYMQETFTASPPISRNVRLSVHRSVCFPLDWRFLVEEHIANICTPLEPLDFLAYQWFFGVFDIFLCFGLFEPAYCAYWGSLAEGGWMDVAVGVSDRWQETGDTGHMTSDMWQLK